MAQWRLIPILTGAVVVLAAGCDGGSGETADSPQLVSPAEFAGVIDDPERVTINVHVPDEGSIADTDLSIPFTAIEARADELPTYRATPLAVYCRSGRMSAIAVETLVRLGYTSIVELDGGMIGWEADGHPLLQPEAVSGA